MQKLPLEHKINLSKNLILNCIETFGDQQVYISFSGGKDSTVLSSLVCSLKPNILHLFSDTGCEYPETLSFVGAERHRGKNIVSVHPICRDGSMVLISFFKRKITNADHYLFGQTKTYGTTLNFAIFLFLIYIVKAIKEMAVCIVALDCAQNDENLELTALNGWRRHTQSNMSI